MNIWNDTIVKIYVQDLFGFIKLFLLVNFRVLFRNVNFLRSVQTFRSV